MSSAIKVVIPARYASSRFPGKPLALIAGEPMVLRVVERAALSGVGEVIVATDDERIKSLCESNSVRCVMTAKDHISGTDRLAEVAESERWNDDTIVVNLQGDEPLMPPNLLRQVANTLLQDAQARIATLCTPISDSLDIFNPNVVKVVTDANQRALYFSRAPIPWNRDSFSSDKDPHVFEGLYRHLGIYAYRVSYLTTYPSLAHSPIERIESLEQLRALWHGESIAVSVADSVPGPGVDVPSDLDVVESLLKSSPAS